MRLNNLVKPIEEMSDEELHNLLIDIRRRKTVERPATKKREQKTEKRQTRAKVSSLEKMLEKLSPDERAELLKQLEA